MESKNEPENSIKTLLLPVLLLALLTVAVSIARQYVYAGTPQDNHPLLLLADLCAVFIIGGAVWCFIARHFTTYVYALQGNLLILHGYRAGREVKHTEIALCSVIDINNKGAGRHWYNGTACVTLTVKADGKTLYYSVAPDEQFIAGLKERINKL